MVCDFLMSVHFPLIYLYWSVLDYITIMRLDTVSVDVYLQASFWCPFYGVRVGIPNFVNHHEQHSNLCRENVRFDVLWYRNMHRFNQWTANGGVWRVMTKEKKCDGYCLNIVLEIC